jgi:lysozyme family protein
MQSSSDRRQFLTGGAAMAAALAAPDLRGVLEAKLPAPLRSLVPGEALEAVGLIGEIVKLEQQAKALRLPASPLSFHEGQLQVSPDQLYQIAMPRLVALIDRSERRAPLLAERAGGLLAKLHRSEYDPPDAWFGESLSPPAPSPANSGLSFPPAYRPARLAAPLLPEEDEPRPVITGTIDLPGTTPPSIEAALPPVATTIKFDALADEYSAWFTAARLRPEYRESTDWHLVQIKQARPRYERLGKRFGIPWGFIAAIHGLEASFNFRAHLHNGDFPLSQRTRQVPAGRPSAWLPPSDWESSAADALRLLGFTGQSDWSVPRMLHRLEAYNGFGYRRAGRASPYLWSFSSLYSRGKFIADGKFDPNARSKQCGGAVMLKLLDLAGELG